MKNNLSEWIKPLRILPCLSGFLGVISCWGIIINRINQIALYSSLECFWVLMSIMLINNYVDRHHDAKKNPPNNFALQNENIFFWYVTIFWIIECFFILLLSRISTSLALLASTRAVIGFSYSWARKIPLAPGVLVPATYVLCLITPVLFGKTSFILWLFILSIAFILYSYEIIKDIEDEATDRINNYKWTIAARWGNSKAKDITRFTLTCAALVLLMFSGFSYSKLQSLGSLLYACLLLLSALRIKSHLVSSKKLVQVGMACFLLVMVLSYS